MIQLFLSYNKFRWHEIGSYLSAAIRIVIYFKGRGMHDSVRWNHCGVVTSDNTVYEAKIRFTKHTVNDLGKYEDMVFLKPRFNINEEVFLRVLEERIGDLYGLWAIICMFIYQVSGERIKIQKRFRNWVCSHIAEAFYLSCEGSVKHHFKNYSYFDPQDFVRLWKIEEIFE
jgi:hypothetical protein